MNIYNKDWRKLRIAAVDTETTGLNPKECRLTEIGIVYFEKGVPVEDFNRLINPEQKINPRASKVSGITDEMVADKKPFSKIKNKVKKRLLDCDVWVAHNEAFDRSFINEEYKRLDISPPNVPVIDTRVFADYLWPKGPNNLDAVVQRLRVMPSKSMLDDLNINRSRHRADYDALLCGLALFRFMSRLPKTLGDLLCIQDWMYKTWFKFTKLGDQRYTRMLDPIRPPKYEED